LQQEYNDLSQFLVLRHFLIYRKPRHRDKQLTASLHKAITAATPLLAANYMCRKTRITSEVSVTACKSSRGLLVRRVEVCINTTKMDKVATNWSLQRCKIRIYDATKPHDTETECCKIAERDGNAELLQATEPGAIRIASILKTYCGSQKSVEETANVHIGEYPRSSGEQEEQLCKHCVHPQSLEYPRRDRTTREAVHDSRSLAQIDRHARKLTSMVSENPSS
jgi:hypothetical protein